MFTKRIVSSLAALGGVLAIALAGQSKHVGSRAGFVDRLTDSESAIHIGGWPPFFADFACTIVPACLDLYPSCANRNWESCTATNADVGGGERTWCNQIAEGNVCWHLNGDSDCKYVFQCEYVNDQCRTKENSGHWIVAPVDCLSAPL